MSLSPAESVLSQFTDATEYSEATDHDSVRQFHPTSHQDDSRFFSDGSVSDTESLPETYEGPESHEEYGAGQATEYMRQIVQAYVQQIAQAHDQIRDDHDDPMDLYEEFGDEDEDEDQDDPMDLDYDMEEDYDDPMEIDDPMDVDVVPEIHIQHMYFPQIHIQHMYC